MKSKADLKKKVFTTLKNKKYLFAYAKLTDIDDYTINLYYKDDYFELISYIFLGNEVHLAENYICKKTCVFTTFDEMYLYLNAEFPTFSVRF